MSYVVLSDKPWHAIKCSIKVLINPSKYLINGVGYDKQIIGYFSTMKSTNIHVYISSNIAIYFDLVYKIIKSIILLFWISL